MNAKKSKDAHDTMWAAIRDQLEDSGINLGALCCERGDGTPRVKVVCVNTDLGDSLHELSRNPRDQVVMVRVDADTATQLDQWVATGAVRSRSEAAALFIREGLTVRGGELRKLGKALRDLDAARNRLRREAKEILGQGGGDEGAT